MVWPRKGLQRFSDGPSGTLLGGPLQLLLPEIHHEDRLDAG